MEETMRARQELNGHGCAFGQVNRERVDNVVDDVNEIKRWLQMVLVAILVQIIVFVSTAFWFVANRAIP